MNHQVDTNWIDGLTFSASIGDHNITMDAKSDVGGRNLGPNPKRLLLSALTGCTGMDVVSLFKKMRIEVEEFSIHAEANLTDEHPIHYDKIHLVYKVAGKSLSREKIQKAIDLSIEKYCGITYMLGKASQLTNELVIEDTVEAV